MAKYRIYMPDSGMKIKMKVVVDDDSTNRSWFTKALKQTKSIFSRKLKRHSYTEYIMIKEEE